jgi:hypothetical protein
MIREAIKKSSELSPRIIGKVASEMVNFDDINIKELKDGISVQLFTSDITMSKFHDDLEDFIIWLKQFGVVITELNSKNKSATIKLTKED